MIDSIFSNTYSQPVTSGILLTDISDHLPIFLIMDESIPKARLTSYTYKRKNSRENVGQFIDSLRSFGWSSVFSTTDPNSAYTLFFDQINILYNQHIPLTRINLRKHQPRKAWITQGLIKSIKSKYKLCSKFVQNRTDRREQKYKAYRNKLSHLLKIAKKQYYSCKLESGKANIKATWKTLKDLLNKSKPQLNYPHSFLHNNVNITNPESIANAFNDYFVNVGINLASKIPCTNTKFTQFLKRSYPNSFVFYPTDNYEIFSILRNINPNKSPGPDCLDPFVIKQAAEPLAPILSYIFNISMDSGRVPDQLKIAKVIPIFKADDNKKFSNYRPISILPIFSKILERVVYTRLVKYFTKHNSLDLEKITQHLWRCWI